MNKKLEVLLKYKNTLIEEANLLLKLEEESKNKDSFSNKYREERILSIEKELKELTSLIYKIKRESNSIFSY